jgi:hypothetical protein
MKAATKTILFSRVTISKAVHQHPVAVFSREPDAKAYAVLLNTAHKSGNVEMAKQLDAKTALAEDGTLIPGIKFALVTVPYAPTLADSGDDLFKDDNAAAS